MLLLVRHADAGNKQRWAGPDSLRPLSANGHAEAAGLVVRLEDYPISRVLSSPTLRCSQTVDPLARDRWLHVDHQEALGVDADLMAVDRLWYARLILSRQQGSTLLTRVLELYG
jgi:phosphohistidine phosphatase SixA